MRWALIYCIVNSRLTCSMTAAHWISFLLSISFSFYLCVCLLKSNTLGVLKLSFAKRHLLIYLLQFSMVSQCRLVWDAAAAARLTLCIFSVSYAGLLLLFSLPHRDNSPLLFICLFLFICWYKVSLPIIEVTSLVCLECSLWSSKEETCVQNSRWGHLFMSAFRVSTFYVCFTAEDTSCESFLEASLLITATLFPISHLLVPWIPHITQSWTPPLFLPTDIINCRKCWSC